MAADSLHCSLNSHPAMITTAANPRAKMPADLASMCKQYRITPRDLLSTNPKTEKSKVQTYILHLAPADTSGVNVCAGAGNCKKICLHFAGNPVYMTNKQAARIRRTLAYAADPKRFLQLIIAAILGKKILHPGETIAVRLNGTSDIAWENVDFNVSQEFATFCRRKYGVDLPLGTRNIFELFNYISAHGGPLIVFYDYTKIKRNWAECKRLGYHLTFSYDGADNTKNAKIAATAIHAGINVAAAFNVKRGQDLPNFIRYQGRKFWIVDGDLTDYRPSDPQGYRIIGLRFKLPHGINYTPVERDSFCIA